MPGPTDEQAESSRRLEEYRLRTEKPPEHHEREEAPFQEERSMGSLASDVLFGKPKQKVNMAELVALQQQANEIHNLMHEQMLRSSSGVEKCAQCEEYYSRVMGHECPKTP